MKMKLNNRQAFILYTLFVLGSVSTIGGTNEAGRDYWLSFLIGGMAGLGFNMIYLSIGQKRDRISRLFKAVSSVTAIFTAAISLSLFTMFISQMSAHGSRSASVILILIQCTTQIICTSWMKKATK